MKYAVNDVSFISKSEVRLRLMSGADSIILRCMGRWACIAAGTRISDTVDVHQDPRKDVDGTFILDDKFTDACFSNTSSPFSSILEMGNRTKHSIRGVIVEYRNPTPTSKQLRMTFHIVDPSCSTELQVVMFRNDFSQFPKPPVLGSVLRASSVMKKDRGFGPQIDIYLNNELHPLCIEGNSGFSDAESPDPERDSRVCHALLSWGNDLLSTKGATERMMERAMTLAEFEEGRTFDCICEVVHVQNDGFRFSVWDGTIRFGCSENRTHPQRPGSSGSVITVNVDRCLVDTVRCLRARMFVRLRNVTGRTEWIEARANSCVNILPPFYKQVKRMLETATRGAVVDENNRQNGCSEVVVKNDDDDAMLRDPGMLDVTNVCPVELQTDFDSTILAEGSERLLRRTLGEIVGFQECPHMFRVSARIIDVIPRHPANIVRSLCGECRSMKNVGQRCGVCGSETTVFMHFLKLKLLDHTGVTTVLLFGDEARTFFGNHFPAKELTEEDVRRANDVIAAIQLPSTEGARLEFLVQSYCSGEDIRKAFRILRTELHSSMSS